MKLKDYIDTFQPEITPILQKKLASLTKQYANLSNLLEEKREYRKFALVDKLKKLKEPKSKWNISWYLADNFSNLKTKKRLRELEIELNNIWRAYSLAGIRKEVELDVETAKEYPIQGLFNGKLKRVSNLLVGNCPFHSETKPSFYIYPDNHFHCFGCGKHGDSIAFVMELDNVDFKTAVKQLI